jgi:hypothetical protein
LLEAHSKAAAGIAPLQIRKRADDAAATALQAAFKGHGKMILFPGIDAGGTGIGAGTLLGFAGAATYFRLLYNQVRFFVGLEADKKKFFFERTFRLQ